MVQSVNPSLDSINTDLPPQEVANLPMEVWKLVFADLEIGDKARLKKVCRSFSEAIGNVDIASLVRKMFEDMRNYESWDDYDCRYERFRIESSLNNKPFYSFSRLLCFDLKGNLKGVGGRWTPFFSKTDSGFWDATPNATFTEVEPTLSFPRVIIKLLWEGGDNVDVRLEDTAILSKSQKGFFDELCKHIAKESHIFILGARKIARDENKVLIFRRVMPELWDQIAADPAHYSNKDIWEAGEAEYNRLYPCLNATIANLGKESLLT